MRNNDFQVHGDGDFGWIYNYGTLDFSPASGEGFHLPISKAPFEPVKILAQ